MATKQQVVDLLAKYPTWSPSDIAARLSCNPSYVRATIARLNGYKPPHKRFADEISEQERAERERDQRDLDMLCDLDEGHSEAQVAEHWGVTRDYVHNLSRRAQEAT